MVSFSPPSEPEANETASEKSNIAHLNVDALAEAVKERRTSAGLSIRRAAETANISFMTLSRVEAGGQPDLTTFLRLCSWLHVPPQTFFMTSAPRQTTTPEVVATHLQADPLLAPEAASSIATVVRDMYAALARKPSAPVTVACHLRAAATLRPGVPQRLGQLLDDMQNHLLELDAEGAL
ncbi:MAG: helix-turn-helix transcriptional regulator [Acidimicrobiaceae bacterium]|nr:helix-turn-helix transcriptional regulator [Acidimicrobiaceae bacterium]